MTSIGRLYVKILYIPIPWEQIAFEGDIIRCIKYASVVLLHYPQPFNPTELNKNFWKEVQQLFFHFQRNDKEKIRSFYARYGRVGAFRHWHIEKTAEHEESYERVKKNLDWFRELTVIVRDIKERRPARLWELFNNAEHESGRYFLWGRDGERNISFAPWLQHTKEGIEFAGPSNDEELFIAAWQAITDSVQEAFHSLMSLPAPQSPVAPASPMTTLNIYPPGALAAGFLQWFFQEVAYMNLTICVADGCERPVLPPRKDYCTERCRQRMKKRRQRENKKEGGKEDGQ